MLFVTMNGVTYNIMSTTGNRFQKLFTEFMSSSITLLNTLPDTTQLGSIDNFASKKTT